MKPGLRSLLPRFVFVLALLVSLVAARSQPITDEQRKDLLEKVAAIMHDRAFVAGVDFTKWPEVYKKHKEAIDKCADGAALCREVNRAMGDFGVSHFQMVTPKGAQQRRTTKMVGVGISTRINDDGLDIVSVVDNSPASEAGLQPGDVIVEVDGKKPDAPGIMAGDDGTTVAIKLRRPGGETKDMTITRREFSTRKPETLDKVGEDAAVLRIPTFSTGYSRQNIDKLMREAAGVKFLVLDLRGNGGGEVANLMQLLSYFLPRDTVIGTSISRNVANDYVKATGKEARDAVEIAEWSKRKQRVPANAIEPFPGEIAILVNRGSASASEICAAALHELRGAPLVGQATSGAVLVSTYQRLSEGFEFKVPMSDFVTVMGVRLEGYRQPPEIEIATPRRGEEDKAIAVAVERLRTVAVK